MKPAALTTTFLISAMQPAFDHLRAAPPPFFVLAADIAAPDNHHPPPLDELRESHPDLLSTPS